MIKLLLEAVGFPAVAFLAADAGAFVALLRPAGARGGPDPQRPELVEGEDPVREAFLHLLGPVELGVAFGIGGSFHVLVRWKEMPRRRSRHRKASRPMRMARLCTRRR